VGGVAALVLFILWLTGEYVIFCLIPFIIAYLVSLPVRRASSFISRRFGVGRRFVSVFIMTALVAALFFTLSFLTSKLLEELSDATSLISDKLSEENNFLKQSVDFFEGLANKIPIFGTADGNAGASVYDALSSLLKEGASRIASFAASAATALLGKLPGLIFALITTVISTVYFCADKGAIRAEAENFIGKRGASRLWRVKRRVNRALSQYLKSYLVMMLITFSELLLGFVILGVDNALLISLIIAFVDLLPVLGSGAVMVPWALIELFVTGNTRLGAGLLIMVAVMYVVRQFAEPHVVGTMIGVHPLLSLTAVYVGYVIFGFAGVIFMPLTVYFIKIAISERRENIPGK
ncbi:MAG: sporulation integral membrane protein YtvI, partial [Clostridia bacterium]|nr:sporulation integral membrane protein YtvI [Clostridia bacterium]